MSPLEPWRALLRPLAAPGFLRRDQREDALFVSDFPRFGPPERAAARIEAAGFLLRLEKGLAHIDAGPERYRALLEALPLPCPGQPTEETLRLHGLALRLWRAQTPLALQPPAPLRLTLKLLDAQTPLPRLPGLLCPALAELQRQGLPLPSGVGQLLFLALYPKEGEAPC